MSFLVAVPCLEASTTFTDGTFTVNDLTDTVSFSDASGTGRLSSAFCNGGGGEFCSFSIAFPSGTASAAITFGGSAVNATEVDLLEPGAPPFTASDILAQSGFTSTSTSWLFTSDSEQGLMPFEAVFLTEDGTPQETFGITYRNADGTVIGADTIDVQSDVETPEPSPGWTALTGLAVLALWIRRRAVSLNQTCSSRRILDWKF